MWDHLTLHELGILLVGFEARVVFFAALRSVTRVRLLVAVCTRIIYLNRHRDSSTNLCMLLFMKPDLQHVFQQFDAFPVALLARMLECCVPEVVLSWVCWCQ